MWVVEPERIPGVLTEVDPESVLTDSLTTLQVVDQQSAQEKRSRFEKLWHVDHVTATEHLLRGPNRQEYALRYRQHSEDMASVLNAMEKNLRAGETDNVRAILEDDLPLVEAVYFRYVSDGIDTHILVQESEAQLLCDMLNQAEQLKGHPATGEKRSNKSR